jgi:hypothetical protein
MLNIKFIINFSLKICIKNKQFMLISIKKTEYNIPRWEMSNKKKEIWHK